MANPARVFAVPDRTIRPAAAAPLTAQGKIVKAPASAADPCWVTVGSFSAEHEYGPCLWVAAQGATLPAVGAACLLVFDDLNTPTVVWFAGNYTGVAGPPGSAGPPGTSAPTPYSTLFGDGASASFTITHSLGVQFPSAIKIINVATLSEEDAELVFTDSNHLQVSAEYWVTHPPGVGAYRIVIWG